MKKYIGKIYWWWLRNFFYNQLNEKLFFRRGYTKIINDIRILLPFRFSWVYPSIYEVDKTNFLRSHCNRGDTVIDIGAHFGVFTILLANEVGPSGKVYSFEPTPFIYEIAKQTVMLNNYNDSVELEKMAVAEENGELEFFVNNSKISNGNSISSHNSTTRGGVVHHKEKIKVKTISLDSLLSKPEINKLKLIKIDAEGAELQILKGGKQLIKKYRPYITLEVHPNSFDSIDEQMLELYTIIKSYNYDIMYENKILSLEQFISFNNFFEVLLMPEYEGHSNN